MKKIRFILLVINVILLVGCSTKCMNDTTITNKNNLIIENIPFTLEDQLLPIIFIYPKVQYIGKLNALQLAEVLNITWINEELLGWIFTELYRRIINFESLWFSIMPARWDINNAESVYLPINLKNQSIDLTFFEGQYPTQLRIYQLYSGENFSSQMEKLYGSDWKNCIQEREIEYINPEYKDWYDDPYWVYKDENHNFVTIDWELYTWKVYARYPNFWANMNDGDMKSFIITERTRDIETGEFVCLSQNISNTNMFFRTEKTPNIYYNIYWDYNILAYDWITNPARIFDINNWDGTSSFEMNLKI